MCGIFGSLTIGRDLPADAMDRALQAIMHRGPDGDGRWFRPSGRQIGVALGHRRLAINDLSAAGLQPMLAPAGNAAMVFNGEIYNFLELRSELEAAGVHFHSKCDSEVLLAAYLEFGAAALARFNGMFAFAIWDEAREALFLARDRFGEKPLYFTLHEDRRSFGFASEIKALLAAGLCGGELDEAALRDYLNDGLPDARSQTVFAAVQRLMPAEMMWVRVVDGQLKIQRETYWRLPASGTSPESIGAATGRFRELFEQSIRLRLRADVAIGTSLSGGIDSSAVICTVKKVGAAGGQRAFTARMSEPRLDEGRYVDEVLRATGIPGYSVVPEAATFVARFSKLCWHMEEPFPATSMFAQFEVMRIAHEQNTTVILDGQGADELLAGYGIYQRIWQLELLRKWQFRQLFAERRHYRQLHGRDALGWRTLGSALWSGGREPPRASAESAAFGSFWSSEWRSGPGPSSFPQTLVASLEHDLTGGPLQALLRYGDRNSMAWARELRQPFLDHELVEYSHALNTACKLHHGVSKRVLREAMRDTVPAVILARHDKLGYQAPLGSWLTRELRSWVEAQLAAAREVLGERLVPDPVAVYRGWTGINDWGNGRALMRLMTLAEGIRQVRSALVR